MSGAAEQYMFPNEPHRFDENDFNRLMMEATQIGASDITLQSGRRILFHLHGRKLWVTKREISTGEIALCLTKIYGDNGVARLRAKDPVNTVREIRITFKDRYRFRVNAKACEAGGEDGIHMTIRTIPSVPPRVMDMGIEPDLLQAMSNQQNGLILVVGKTGSGKSTLLAAVQRFMAENPDNHKKVETYEDPIEFVFDPEQIDMPSTEIIQHEVGRHLASYESALEHALRSAPDIVQVGEARTASVTERLLEVALTGHLAYSTFHAGSIVETMSRLMMQFGPNERASKLIEIIDTARVIVAQVLVRRADGSGRCALREYLIFDRAIRDELVAIGEPTQVLHRLGQLVEERGQSMRRVAEERFAEGIIDAHTRMLLVRADEKGE